MKAAVYTILNSSVVLDITCFIYGLQTCSPSVSISISFNKQSVGENRKLHPAQWATAVEKFECVFGSRQRQPLQTWMTRVSTWFSGQRLQRSPVKTVPWLVRKGGREADRGWNQWGLEWHAAGLLDGLYTVWFQSPPIQLHLEKSAWAKSTIRDLLLEWCKRLERDQRLSRWPELAGRRHNALTQTSHSDTVEDEDSVHEYLF